jgi:hypothetical protein
MRGKLYHMGFRGRITRSTLADANEAHDWRIFADFALVLIAIARPLYADDPLGVDQSRWHPSMEQCCSSPSSFSNRSATSRT